MNPGFGLNEFSREVGINANDLADWLSDIDEQLGVNLYELLNEEPLYTEDEYIENFRTKPEKTRIVYRQHPDGSIENLFRARFRNRQFDWGVLSRYSLKQKIPDSSETKGNVTKKEIKQINDWIDLKIREKGYICSNEDRDDFIRICRSESQTLTRSMRKAGLLYDKKTGRWTKGNR